MKIYLCGLSLLTWATLGLGFQEPAPPAGTPRTGEVVDLGGLKSQVPANWLPQGPEDAQCYKQYRLEPIDDDKNRARITVCSAGKGKGQSAADYITRWKAMFLAPEGMTIEQASQVRKLTVNRTAATLFDIRGDFKGAPGDDTSPRQNYRMLAVYLNAPKGPYVIRLLGPNRTVEYYQKSFENWVKAFK
jgi:hypothetical protein